MLGVNVIVVEVGLERLPEPWLPGTPAMIIVRVSILIPDSSVTVAAAIGPIGPNDAERRVGRYDRWSGIQSEGEGRCRFGGITLTINNLDSNGITCATVEYTARLDRMGQPVVIIPRLASRHYR